MRKQDVNLLEFKGYIHSMAIKRSLFDQIRFPECYWYEDMIVRLLLLRRTEEIRCIDKILYTKRKHSVNAANTVWNQASYQALDQVFLVKNMYLYEKKYYPWLLCQIRNSYFNC